MPTVPRALVVEWRGECVAAFIGARGELEGTDEVVTAEVVECAKTEALAK